MTRATLIKKAKMKSAQLSQLKADSRYTEVMASLKAEKILDLPGIRARKRKLNLQDLLWVGDNIEPRVLEILPALLLKRPGLVYTPDSLEQDLKLALTKLKKRDSNFSYKGLDGSLIIQWVPLIGRRNKWPKQTKDFRLCPKHCEILQELATQKGVSESEIVRKALEAYHVSSNPAPEVPRSVQE